MEGCFIAVFNGSKILIWKQITTKWDIWIILNSCFQWFKDTNLKANHNYLLITDTLAEAVFNGSKILIWKQITTWITLPSKLIELFSMVQRY